MTGPLLPPPAWAASLPAAVRTAAGVRLLPGLPYAGVPGQRPVELDLHLPADAPRPPVVLFLHGGGWRLGSRHSVGPMYARASPSPVERLVAAGFAVACADYRLSGEATWPAQLHDVKAAVRWLRARADELGVDASWVAAWGESAGGHLAALLGLTGRGLDGDLGMTEPSSAVQAVVAWYPPTDLLALAEGSADPLATDTREALLLGAAAPTVPELATSASPVTYVSPSAPPFLLLHGSGDRLVRYAQSELLATALRAAGGEVELGTYEGADHMWLGAPQAADLAVDRTVSFLLARHAEATRPARGEPVTPAAGG